MSIQSHTTSCCTWRVVAICSKDGGKRDTHSDLRHKVESNAPQCVACVAHTHTNVSHRQQTPASTSATATATALNEVERGHNNDDHYRCNLCNIEHPDIRNAGPQHQLPSHTRTTNACQTRTTTKQTRSINRKMTNCNNQFAAACCSNQPAGQLSRPLAPPRSIPPSTTPTTVWTAHDSRHCSHGTVAATNGNSCARL